MNKRFATAKLMVDVKPVDMNPPVIRASATEGFVDENAAIGTKVVDFRGNAVYVTVTDADLVRVLVYTSDVIFIKIRRHCYNALRFAADSAFA